MCDDGGGCDWRAEPDEISVHVTQQERAVLAALDEWAREKRIVGGDF